MFETLKGRIPKSIDEDEYRKFAVMVALLKQEDGLHVVFEKRAGGLKRQPGEICLPGGARDGNESSETNAIRETMEELKVSREQIHMIAQMDTLYTAYDNKVSVYLCELTKGYTLVLFKTVCLRIVAFRTSMRTSLHKYSIPQARPIHNRIIYNSADIECFGFPVVHFSSPVSMLTIILNPP